MLRLPKIFAFHHFNFTLKTVLFFYLKMCQSEKSDFFFFLIKWVKIMSISYFKHKLMYDLHPLLALHLNFSTP